MAFRADAPFSELYQRDERKSPLLFFVRSV